MPSILDEIATYKREFVAGRRRQRSLADVRSQARDTEPAADFGGALRQDGMSLIAEIKKASPSRGVIREDFSPQDLARVYAENGARALSVLTDEAYFQGCDAYLAQARRASRLPVLRKDFTIDEYQIHEARCLGADAILVIVALMDGTQLQDYIGLGEELGMGVLVEIHTAAERARALAAPARLIGINNRNLHTFETDLETTVALATDLPREVTLVSESGIATRADVERLQAAGVAAILVGETLMRAPDTGACMRELLAEGR